MKELADILLDFGVIIMGALALIYVARKKHRHIPSKELDSATITHAIRRVQRP